MNGTPASTSKTKGRAGTPVLHHSSLRQSLYHSVYKLSVVLILAQEGHQRAQCLAHMLAEAEIRKIFVTEITRTQQTADPLAQILSLKPVVVGQKDIQGMVTQLQADTSENVLVVAHSETLPKILSALGAKVPKITQEEFDRLFVFHYDQSGKQGTVTTLRYCSKL